MGHANFCFISTFLGTHVQANISFIKNNAIETIYTNKERRTNVRIGMEEIGVQQKYAANSICFGCGPANKEGLRINSTRIENGLYLEYMPEEHHQAFPGMIWWNNWNITRLPWKLDCSNCSHGQEWR